MTIPTAHDLRTHLRTVHHNEAAIFLADGDALEQHWHEHHGPGGIRNHDDPPELHDWPTMIAAERSTIPTAHDAVESVAAEAFAMWRHDLYTGGDLDGLGILDDAKYEPIARAGLRFGAAAMLKRLTDLGLIDRQTIAGLTGTHYETELDPPKL